MPHSHAASRAALKRISEASRGPTQPTQPVKQPINATTGPGQTSANIICGTVDDGDDNKRLWPALYNTNRMNGLAEN